MIFCYVFSQKLVGTMYVNKSITVEPKVHRGARRWLVRFWYDPHTISLVRSLDARYSATHGCWYVDYTADNLKRLQTIFRHDHLIILDEQTAAKKHAKGRKRQATGAMDYCVDLNERQEAEIKQYIQYMRGQRYSNNTVAAYAAFVRSLLGFYKDKETAYITLRDIHRYNYQVILANGYSVSYQRQFIGAIKLFFDYVAHCSFNTEELERPRKEYKLPTVLSKEEVRRLIISTSNLKHKAIISTLYAAGLRVSELLNLRIGHIDADRMLITVRMGKGRKDRYVKMSKANLLVLQQYLHQYTPRQYVFEGPEGNRYSSSSVRNIIRRATARAKVRKHVTPHTLRHSYATHLLELGVDLRYVQSLLGHKKPETTMIYTHISSDKVSNLVNPLDELFKEDLIGLAVKRNGFVEKTALIPGKDWGYW